MKVNLKKEKDNVVILDIQVPAQDAANEYNKAVRKVSEHVNIPGFRKGKAPRNIVEKHVGTERIQQEALERMLPGIFKDAITKNDLDIVSQPYVESYDFNSGGDLKIVAKVELRPEVILGEYKGMKLEAQEYTLPKDAFDKALEGFLQQHVKYEPVSDRPIKETDIAVIDFDGTVNGEKIKGGAAQNYPLDLANSNFIPGFAEQLTGKNLNEEFDIEVKFPETYHEAKLAGQPAVFRVKIKEIKAKILPELTDEFAQQLGTFTTVEDLKADIQKYLDTTKQSEDAKIISNTIFEKILSDVKIEIQNSMIERETESLLEEYKQRLMMQGIEWQKAVESQGEENILKSLREEALLRIKNSLVIDEIAKTENIKIGPEELDKKLKEIEEIYKMPRAELMKQLSQNPQIFSSLSQQALNEKVSKFLNDNNTVELKIKKEKKVKSAD